MFKCNVCNYIHEGTEAPEKCPKCGAPKEQFAALADEARTLVMRSRFTNHLHMQILGLLNEIDILAGDGINDNLDPMCVTVFTRAQNDARQTVAFIRAEMEGHMKKGKWG